MISEMSYNIISNVDFRASLFVAIFINYFILMGVFWIMFVF